MFNYSMQKGFTLLEALIVVAITGVILTFAVNAWGLLMAQKRARASMETLYDHIKLARSESIKRRSVITISFRDFAGARPSWCYALSDGGDCDCRVANACTFEGSEVLVNDAQNPQAIGITNLTGPAGAKYIEFEGVRGTVTNSGSIQFTDNGFTGMISVNAMGFISNCSNNIAGYPSC